MKTSLEIPCQVTVLKHVLVSYSLESLGCSIQQLCTVSIVNALERHRGSSESSTHSTDSITPRRGLGDSICWYRSDDVLGSAPYSVVLVAVSDLHDNLGAVSDALDEVVRDPLEVV